MRGGGRATRGACAGPCSILRHARAYAARTTTPAEVAEAVLQQLEASERRAPPLRLLLSQDAQDLRAQALASTRRRADPPLRVFSGSPSG